MALPGGQRTSEMGRTGLQHFSGNIQNDFLREMQGKEAYKRFQEMRLNSPVIGALLYAIEQSVRHISWSFESEEGEEDPRIEFLNAARANLRHSWNDHVIEALTMLPFGFSLFEIVYERVGGNLLWRKFGFRGQDTVDRWKFDDEGGLDGFVQRAAPTYLPVEIPIEKLVLYRTRVERNNPEGRSILRTAWVPYYYAKHIQQIEAIGIERDLAGLPMVKMPEGADPTESDSDSSDWGRARRLVANVRNDEQAGVVVPPGWEFSLLSSGGQRQFDTDKVVSRYESRMLMSALAQFIMLGQENVGSLALSKDQTDFFTMSVNAIADIISETFTKFAVARLLRLNGLDPDGVQLTHTPAGDFDLQGMADFLEKTGQLITWTTQDEMWLRETAGLPMVEPEVIEEEREAKRGLLAQLQRNQERSSDDDMSADYEADEFAADPPDEDERGRIERMWQDHFSKFLKKQRRRVLKAVEDLRA